MNLPGRQSERGGCHFSTYLKPTEFFLVAENCKQDLCILIKHFYDYLYLRVQRNGLRELVRYWCLGTRDFFFLSHCSYNTRTQCLHGHTCHTRANITFKSECHGFVRLLVSGAANSMDQVIEKAQIC